MKNTYTGRQIEKISDGRVTQINLRNWVKPENNFFNTPLEEPRAGHSRKYNIEAVVEAFFICACSSSNIPLKEAKRMWPGIIAGQKKFIKKVYDRTDTFSVEKIITINIDNIVENLNLHGEKCKCSS